MSALLPALSLTAACSQVSVTSGRPLSPALLTALFRERVLRPVTPGPHLLTRALLASMPSRFPRQVEVQLWTPAQGDGLRLSAGLRYVPPAVIDFAAAVRTLRTYRMPGLTAAALQAVSASCWRTRPILCPHHIRPLDLHATAFGSDRDHQQLLDALGLGRKAPRTHRRKLLHQHGLFAAEDAERMYDQEAAMTSNSPLPVHTLPAAAAERFSQLSLVAAQARALNAGLGMADCGPDSPYLYWARTRTDTRDQLGLLAQQLYDRLFENGHDPLLNRTFLLDQAGIRAATEILRTLTALDRLAIRSINLLQGYGAR